MKKLTTSIIIYVTLFFSDTSAQFFIGASGGLNIATARLSPSEAQKPDDHVKPSSLVFTHLGVVPGFQLSDKLSIQMDVQLSHKGFHGFGPGITNERHRFTYLDFLPQVEYAVFKNLSIGTGFNVGFMIREMFRIGNLQWQPYEFVETVKLADMGLVGSVKLNYKKFFLVGRYNHGLLNINSVFLEDMDNRVAAGIHRNITFQIGAGYIFHREKERSAHRYY